MTIKNNEEIDGLELKEKIKKEMWAEYEANKDKFETYGDYLDFICSQSLSDPKLNAWLEDVKKHTEAKRRKSA